MSPIEDLRVVHVVPPGGGGVDRCVRDIVARRPRDLILHAAVDQHVIEWPGQRAHAALQPAAVAAAAAQGALGRPLAIHAHGTVPSVRAACAALGAATSAPLIVTLHDIWFADPTLPGDELGARLDFVRSAVARTAPSRFIVERAHATLGPAVEVRWIPNGADPFGVEVSAALDETSRAAIGDVGFAIAVIGAIGEHKGLSALEQLAVMLPQDRRIVVFGYTGNQLRRGWAIPGRMWVHGVFEPAELPALARAHDARLAFFPPGMPESYCYALTDAWMSGLSVLAPAHGAIAERVRDQGGGHLYPPTIGLDELAALLLKRLDDGEREPQPTAPPSRVPSVQAMIDAMTDEYSNAASGQTPREADDASLQRLAQTHLDASFMRREVVDLQRMIEDLQRQHEALREQFDSCRNELAAARSECEDWRSRYQGLAGRLTRPLALLPTALRDRLVQWGKRLLVSDRRR